MKTKHKVIIAAVGFGLLFWVTDALLDYLIFYDGTLAGLLITHVPAHELYTRAAVLVIFIIASVIVAVALVKRDRAEARVTHLNQVLRAVRNVNQLIVREKDRNRLIQEACTQLTETRGYESAWIVLFDDGQSLPYGEGELTAAESGLGDEFDAVMEALRHGPLPHCGQYRRDHPPGNGIVVIQDPATTCAVPGGQAAPCPVASRYRDHSVLSTQLVYAEKIYGLMTVSLPAHFATDEDEQALLLEVAGDIAFALHNIALEEEHRRIDEALRQANAIIERSPAVAFVWDNAEAWPVAFASQNAGRLFGWTADDFTSGAIPYAGVIHPDDLDRVVDEVVQAGADPTRTTLHHAPYRIVRRDGAVRWVEDITHIRRDAGGAVMAYEGILLDITPRKQAEDALRAEEKRYRVLFDNAGVLISVYDRDGICHLMNQKTAALFGGKPEDFIGRSFHDLHPEAAAAYIRRIRRAIDTGTSQRYEDEVTFPTGTHWLLSIVHPVPDTRGNVRTAQIISQDITQRKQAEDALAFQAMLLNQIRDQVTATDLDGTVLYVNEAASRSLKRSREDILGKPVSIFGDDPAQGATQQEIVDQTLENGAWRGEIVNYAADGTEIIMDCRTALVKDAEGNPASMVGIATDITERRRAQERLHESEEKYRLLAETIPDIIALHDIQGRIVYLNQAALDFSGYTSAEAIGQPIATFIAPEYQAELKERRTRRLSGDEDAYRYETVFISSDGQRVPFEVNSKPVMREGQVSELLVVARDISDRQKAERILRESEARFRTLFEEAPDAIFIETLDDRILDANRAATQMLGYSRAEFQTMTVADLQAPEVRGEPGTIVTQEIPQGHFESIDLRKDGTTVPVEVNVRRIRLGGEDVVLSVVRDITDRKKAEYALRRSRARLIEAQHIAKIGDVTWNVATGEVAWSDSMFDLLHYDKSEVIDYARVNREIHHPDDLQRVTSWIDEAIAAGRKEMPPHDYRLIRKDGEIIHVHAEGVIEWQGGQATRVFATVQDITEQRQAEAARERLTARIREQAQQMAQILATVPAGVLLLDAQGRILRANPVAEETVARLGPPGPDNVLTRLGDRPLAELLTSPPTRGLWHEVEAGNRIFEIIARPVESGPEPELWVLVISDATREREIRAQLRQQERLAAVGQLAAGIAHDFNNIMATIVLYAQMTAGAADLSKRGRKRMAVIQEQAWHATRLIEQILDFSRRAVLERMPLDLELLLKEQVKLLERTLPENIRIELAYERDDYTVKADPTRMQQVITNLAVNARDAMPDGGTLRIALARIILKPEAPRPRPKMEPGTWIRLTVSDTGAGIAPEHLPRIFEPFFTTKKPGQGSGLGLAQVHGIVGLHEGHIDVSSRPGEGTTFTIYLPALHLPRPTELPPRATGKGAVRMGQGETILVVEDDATLRTALAESLMELNYEVLEASSGHAALELLAQNVSDGRTIALVLSDLVMPEMGGQALFHAMRERGIAVPVVMLSGHPMEHELERLHTQGLAGWMLKPPDIGELAEVLAEALKGRTP